MRSRNDELRGRMALLGKLMEEEVCTISSVRDTKVFKELYNELDDKLWIGFIDFLRSIGSL